MKTNSKKFLYEDNTQFSERELKRLIGVAVVELWRGYNSLELAIRYLQTTGQGGTVSAFDKKFNISKLKDIIDSLDVYGELIGEGMTKSFRHGTLKEIYNRIRGVDIISEGKFRAEVGAVGEDVWSRNGMEYETEEEAKEWLNALSQRWVGYDISRVVPVDTPDRERIDLSDPTIYQNYRR